ncbi:MAG: tRNA guanosine(34) transglycosylase Tgt [Syntrophales bacterium]|nr:tRNA guanosine(34) transglycosylase Tgt [Syntrophales bacterium]
MNTFSFTLMAYDRETEARRGKIQTRRGDIQTPTFMPVGTHGTVKALIPEMLVDLGAEIILSNTYHLYLRPGHGLINSLGGLHKFMNWTRPILTDSGGFQIYSLGDLRSVKEEGVYFRSHIDGSSHFLSPEKAIEVQMALGSDIMMVLDECIPYPLERRKVEASLEKTIRWAKRCKKAHDGATGALFGIVQGGMYKDLRKKGVEDLVEVGFDGYALGGLSVGEPKELMYEVINETAPLLPSDRPRYLMGVGKPEDLVACVAMGIDMFDCVIPTRCARNGLLFTKRGKLVIKHARYRDDSRPVDETCDCYTCRHFSRAYLRHLFMAKEILAMTLNTVHNLRFYVRLMEMIREAIETGTFREFSKDFFSQYGKESMDERRQET